LRRIAGSGKWRTSRLWCDDTTKDGLIAAG